MGFRAKGRPHSWHSGGGAVLNLLVQGRVRTLVLVALGLLPASRIKNRVMSIIPGIDVHPRARIAPGIVFNVRRFSVGPGASIGLGNIFRGLEAVQMGTLARIGSWNWITAAPMFSPYDSAAGEGSLILGNSTAVTSRHYLDCTGGLSFGDLTTIAGVRSTWFTHRIDLLKSVQFSRRTQVGKACFVASGVQVGPGVEVPDNSVIAMGSVVTKSLADAGRLYGGVPVRDLGPAKNDGYVRRSKGHVLRASSRS